MCYYVYILFMVSFSCRQTHTSLQYFMLGYFCPNTISYAGHLKDGQHNTFT